ncbi:16S rRNA (cytosine(967)-C(5))-methyltransferase RsmB [Luteimonas viscosa]|uniref:16S rRNA (cytosine(967)-C(5))-methyltransferase n=1 Tax=Luteimonas viscosa TaxID=1132694 RepID=A0A5D4XPS9_9GAMM|nr:16S rRNA (cytosine(967)-C(5))-methyltransferase RsmB [Luteimonas viscosa]TYT25965.1 16S rRNA (cytosine(967)-C(5))-methyltransferase RsmB [Luteimonas viscosa]
MATEPSAAPGVTARVIAAGILDAVLHRGRSLKAELASALPSVADPRDRALVEAICFAALRNRARYDAALAAWMPRPLPRRDAPLRALLHAGFAQLDPLALSAHAALAATVDAARSLGHAHQAGLVNALLRRAQRDGLPAGHADAVWPDWLRDRVRTDWPADADAIFTASASPAPTWLRVNRMRGTAERYAARLREAGLESQAVADLPDALRIDVPVSPTALPGFADGDVSVQDAAAQRVADALSPPRGARVLDACAAPGGKSAHLLERDPALRLTALDVDARRLRQVRGTFERLGVGADARLLAADATDTAAWWDGEPFEAILLDAPCSATGIVRRQPDLLLHRRPSDLAALAALQGRLLDALWPLLAPGGRLLYATCSILAQENRDQVQAFVARTPGAAIEDLPDAFGRDTGHGRQCLPGERGADGFFYALFSRGA